MLMLCPAFARAVSLRVCALVVIVCAVSLCVCVLCLSVSVCVRVVYRVGFKGCRKTEPVANSAKETYPNVPASLPMVLEAVAKAYGESVTVDQVALATTQNAQRFFGF
jgi:hypothetical protein